MMHQGSKTIAAQDWDAAAQKIERLELEKLLNDIGICRFDARIRAELVNVDLARDVMRQYVDDINQPVLLRAFKKLLPR